MPVSAPPRKSSVQMTEAGTCAARSAPATRLTLALPKIASSHGANANAGGTGCRPVAAVSRSIVCAGVCAGPATSRSASRRSHVSSVTRAASVAHRSKTAYDAVSSSAPNPRDETSAGIGVCVVWRRPISAQMPGSSSVSCFEMPSSDTHSGTRWPR